MNDINEELNLDTSDNDDPDEENNKNVNCILMVS